MAEINSPTQTAQNEALTRPVGGEGDLARLEALRMQIGEKKDPKITEAWAKFKRGEMSIVELEQIANLH